MSGKEPKWAEAGKRYRIAAPNKILFSNSKYLDRMKKEREDWQWPKPTGDNRSDEPLPWLTIIEERVKILEFNTIIYIEEILYKGLPPEEEEERGYFQAALVTEEISGLKGFVWLVYENTEAVEHIEDTEEDSNLIKRKITDDELKYGLVTELGKEYELTVPVYEVEIIATEDGVTDESKYTMVCDSGDFHYKKTLTIGEDKIIKD